MSDSPTPQSEPGQATSQDVLSALFANLVIQQTNTALMLLGRVPNPETGERVLDLDAARMFIDQLDMIEVKTKGNLDKREQQLLNQSLTTLRMAFVEAVESGPEPAAPGSSTAAAQPEPAGSGPKAAEASETPAASVPDDEHRKKFSKKY